MFDSKRNSPRTRRVNNAVYTSYQPYQLDHRPPTRRSSHRLLAISIKLGVSVIIVGGLILAGQRILGIDARAKAAARESAKSSLSQEISAIRAANPQVTVAASLIDVISGEQTNFGSTQAVTAASTTKLVTALDYLRQVELGNYSLNDTLDDGTSGWQLQELINQSDDDSWTDFINLLGKGQIQNYAHQIGLNSFTFSSNSISPAEEANMLSQLYQGKLLNPNHTKLLLSYMQHTNDESLIPAALPPSATIYHKYGELLDATGNYVNDAAIIINDGHTYVFTIYTDRRDELDITTRQNIIHHITQDVVDYENKL